MIGGNSHSTNILFFAHDPYAGILIGGGYCPRGAPMGWPLKGSGGSLTTSDEVPSVPRSR